MPKKDKYRNRIVPLEYECRETLRELPVKERMTLILVSGGYISLVLNEEAFTLSAPCMLLITCYDQIRLLESKGMIVSSFSFHPCFINSMMTFEALARGNFSELEDIHDRNMMEMFLVRDEVYRGYMNLLSGAFVRLREWQEIMGKETDMQTDGYWTCRIRRYLLQSLYLLDDIRMQLREKHSQIIQSL